MSTRWFALLVCAILLALGVRTGAADADAAGGPNTAPIAPATVPTTLPVAAHDIARAVAQLGDDDPRVRDAATRKLGIMGKAALPALREAASGDDPEVASRARRLLAEFRFGIDPETPAALMQLVNLYRGDPGPGRQQVINQLAQLGWAGYRVLARLHGQETDPDWRLALAAPLREQGPNIVSGARDMLLAGREDDAEARLADAAGGDDGLVARSYAALLLSRGRVDDALRELRGEVGEKPGADDALLLAFLYRAKGDADNALRYARLVPPTPGLRSDAEEMVREILVDRHDWAPLIAEANRRAEEANQHVNEAPYQALRRGALAAKLTYARLAGDAKSIDETIAAIHQAAEQSPELVPGYANALILNDRSAEGIDMLVKGKDYLPAYQLMVGQGRYKDAAKLLADAQTESPPDMAELELTAARRLNWLGEKDGAAALVDGFEKEIEPESPNPAQADLIETELALGRTEKAFERAVKAMAAPLAANGNVAVVGASPADLIMNGIAPGGGAQAMAWRGFLADQHPKAAPAEILQKVWALYSRKLPAAEAEALLRDAADNAAGQKPADRIAIYQRLTETAQAIGRNDLADIYYQKWADDADAAIVSGWFPWKVLGDRAMARKDYSRAVDCYDKAVQRSSAQVPICLWLHGWAITQAAAGDADKVEKARAEMRRADEYLLADDGQWLAFLEAVGEAGADSTGDAEAQRELMRRVAEPGSSEFSASYRLSARGILPASENPDELEVPDTTEAPQRAGPRYLRSADLLSRWMLRVEYGESQFIMPDAYLIEPAHIHSLRARGLIATGDIPAAMKEADLSLSIMPENSQLPIDLVPALDRSGHKAEADALFNKVAAKTGSAADRNPKAVQLHNGFAWMCAKCDRDLDKALADAEVATKLEPDSVAYLDTLAEVHFHRGERQAAIDTMKHCIELDPHFEYLRHQLKRFGGASAMDQ